MKIAGLLLIIMVATATCHNIKTHKCVHDTKFKGYKSQVMEDLSEETYRRRLQGSGSTSGSSSTSADANVNDGWHQLRIFADYAYANKLINSNPSLGARYEMSIRLVESVKAYFNRLLNVNFMPIMRFSGGECYNNKIPAYEKPIDLYITIFPENDANTDYFAAATPCYLSTRDGRPTIGAYILNFAFLKATPLNEYLYFSTFAHEFTHILGFSNDLFTRYVDSTGRKRTLAEVTTQITIGSETFTAIKLPEVVNFARTYFNCPNLQGVPLENNGGDGSAGSHWEKLFLPQEYMNPTIENPGIISQFTLTLLKATGWYQVDMGGSQAYDWAAGAGCNIFQICPQGINGYCTSAEVGQSVCSSEYYSKVFQFLTLGPVYLGQNFLFRLLYEEIKGTHLLDT